VLHDKRGDQLPRLFSLSFAAAKPPLLTPPQTPNPSTLPIMNNTTTGLHGVPIPKGHHIGDRPLTRLGVARNARGGGVGGPVLRLGISSSLQLYIHIVCYGLSISTIMQRLPSFCFAVRRWCILQHCTKGHSCPKGCLLSEPLCVTTI